LLAKGHRRIGFIGDTSTVEYGIHPINNRLTGLRRGLELGGSPVNEEDILITPYYMETTRTRAREFLNKSDRPTAFFSATDLQAIAVIRAARELNIRIPEDLAIIGFDDIDLADYIGLTTIRQHLDESGRVAAELLLSRLAGRSKSIQHIHLPLEIIERETV
jgi:DNA-binding LacI/PurR family transcriptional regulator